MNKTSIKYLSAAALFCCLAIEADSGSTNGVSPTFVIRSQSSDNARKVVGESNLTHLDRDSKYWTLAVTPGYSQSFRPGRIAHTLFGNSLVNTTNSDNKSCDDTCGNTILIQGSQYNEGNRDAHAWLADNFFLPSQYNGSFTVTPRISNFFVDFDMYVGLGEFLCGGNAYFRVYAPFVHTKWNLNFCEQVLKDTGSYPAGYFSNSTDPVLANQLNTSFGAYANGGIPTILGSANNLIKADALEFAKISECSRTKNGLADLRAELGWDFLLAECYHLGVNLQAAAPTGSRRHAEYLFDPVIGNGHHWEFGGGVTGHWQFWSNDNDTRHLGVYLDANITHLFKAHEQRTFDLIDKPNSRYMLAAKMGPNTDDLTGGGILANRQFANEYTPVANLTTFDLKVSAAVQADVALWLNYTSCGWSWDLGYNFFGRSKEKFERPDCNRGCAATICDESQKNTWVLKGDARVFGFGLDSNDATPLSASQSQATICSGRNAIVGSCIGSQPVDTFYHNNCGVDNKELASAGGLLNTFPNEDSTNPIYTSIQPIFVKCEDVDFAATRIITNKVFTHLSYEWECECYTPFFGIGGSAEFGNNKSCGEDLCSTSTTGCTSVVTTNDSCNDACDKSNRRVNTSLSQWSVWVKGGISFN